MVQLVEAVALLNEPAEQSLQASRFPTGENLPGPQSAQIVGPLAGSAPEALPNLPASHTPQEVAPDEGAAVPALQGVQTTAPGVLLKRPGAQMVHA